MKSSARVLQYIRLGSYAFVISWVLLLMGYIAFYKGMQGYLTPDEEFRILAIYQPEAAVVFALAITLLYARWIRAERQHLNTQTTTR